MNTRRSFLEGAGGALLLSFVPWSPAYGAQVVDVRAWPAEEYTRITIEHDAPMKFKYFVLRNSDPVRLAVDIDGLLLTDKLKQIIQKVKPNDPYISRIRVGQNRPNVVRISIDFKTDVDPQVFSLKPAGHYRYRLVFDIYPATQKDPLMAIIQKEESEPDAIKSLLAQVAEGQKRMEENRADSGEEVDQLGQILAGIADGTLAPMRPDEEPKGTSKPSQTKPAKKPETQLAQTKPSKTKPTRSPRVRTLVIMIDPGHGGEDPGKIGVNQAKEKDVNLKIAKKTKERLEKKGWKVVMTREKDVMLGDPAAGNKKIHDMKARVERINKTMPQAAVSIHQNSYQDAQIHGAQVFYYSHSEEGKRMAEVMQKALLKADEENTRQAKANDTYYLLKRTEVPTIIVECGFLSNPEEAAKLVTPKYQEKLAEAIAEGILACMEN